MGQHRVRPERADLADELLSKRQLVRKGTVGLVQERDPRVADDLRGACLLDFTQRCQLERIESGVLTARVTARTADQPARRARVDPARGRRRGSEIRVVGMSHDHHEPVGPPRVILVCGSIILISDIGIIGRKRTNRRNSVVNSPQVPMKSM